MQQLGHKTKSGFTLIEITIVLIIISLIIGMAVTSSMAVISNVQISATTQRMAAIEQALMSFRIANDRLPCPSDMTIAPTVANYGVEDDAGSGSATAVGSGSCRGGTPQARIYSNTPNSPAVVSVAEGGVPTVTLGLPSDFMYDGWGNRIRYAVDSTMTMSGAFTSTQVGAIAGAITVKTTTASGSATRSSGAIYVLISHGQNGHGAYTQNGLMINAGSTNADEQSNCHCDSSATLSANPVTATYIQGAPYITTPGSPLTAFDDIVTYKERWQMRTDWDKTGTSNPGVYIVDYGNNRIQKLDLLGNYSNQFGSSGTTDSSTKFTNPFNATTDSSGNIYVADAGNNRVEKFSVDASGNATFVFEIGCGYNGVSNAACTPATNVGHGTGTGMFNAPEGVAIDSNNNIWIVEQNNNRVQKFDNNGNWLLTIPSSNKTASTSGYANSSFNSPYEGSK